jgi:spectinomycin phosphotransferase
MLEKPDLQDERIAACLLHAYGIRAAQVVFLPLGADVNTAVYRVGAEDQTPYFFKLRRGVFHEISVALPKFLSDQGIEQVIAPLATSTRGLWASMDPFKVILYPFIEGHDAYDVALSDRQWIDFGTALRSIHTLVLPPALSRRIRRETYAPRWRETTRSFLERVEVDVFDEPVAVKLAAFLKTRRDEILDLVGRAERLAGALGARSPQFVLCHSDIHAGNMLLDTNDAFYIVDWDDPILAPKERDLMFIGGGLMGNWRTPQEEEILFYRGYGQTQIDPIALAYYRYERIVQDIAAFCEQILLTDKGGADREQSLRYLTSNFMPHDTIEIAYRSDKTLSDAWGAGSSPRGP